MRFCTPSTYKVLMLLSLFVRICCFRTVVCLTGIAGTVFPFGLLARDAMGNVRGIEGDPWIVRAALQYTGIGVEGTCTDPARNGTYSCQYVPTRAGTYWLGITLLGSHVRASPYTVNVTYAALNSARCNASGPGLSVRMHQSCIGTAAYQFYELHSRDTPAVAWLKLCRYCNISYACVSVSSCECLKFACNFVWCRLRLWTRL